MHPKTKHIYVGIDLHKEKHVAVIIDCWNEKKGEIHFANKPSAFSEFMEKINLYAEDGITPVYGLEDVGGYGRALAMFLVAQKQIVKSVNPSLASDKRNSNPNPKKNDSWDAQNVAKVLLDELNRLPDANPQDLFYTIKNYVNRRNSLVKDLTRLRKQLHNEISHHYPSYKKFFSNLIGKTALVFWSKYPSPHYLAEVNAEEFGKFLRKHSNNSLSTKKAMEILAIVKADGDTTRSGQEDKDFLIQGYVRHVTFTLEEMKQLEDRTEKFVMLAGYKLETMTGISLVTSADLIAQIGDINRFKNNDKLARYAGIAPNEYSSGNKETVKKSKFGDRHMHELFYDLAIRQLALTKGKKEPRNHALYAFYESKIAAGKTKKQAIVCIMRKLVSIIFSMMKNKTPYIMPSLPLKRAI